MRMKSISKYTLVITLFCVGATSCTDLDEEIQGDFTKTFAPANQGVGQEIGAAGDGLESAFNRLLNGTANHESYFSVQEISF